MSYIRNDSSNTIKNDKIVPHGIQYIEHNLFYGVVRDTSGAETFLRSNDKTFHLN